MGPIIMGLRLPTQSCRSLGLEPDGIVRRIERFLTDPVAAGYVLVQTESQTNLLFLLHGKTFCAGSFQNDRFAALSIARFFASLSHARRVDLCSTDLALFLCTAVMFRKAPAAQVPSNLMDSASLLNHVEQMGKDAVLVVRRRDARNLVFCREGRPQAVYPARDEDFPQGPSLEDRIIEYIYADPTEQDVILDLYDEIRLPPASDAGLSVKSYREPSAIPSGPQPVLVVQLGQRVVFRYPFHSDEITVGRGGGNDLTLDNLSVSRRHARIRLCGSELLVEDLDSENGLFVKGKKAKRTQLKIDDDVVIGKYTLTFRQLAPGVPVCEPQRPSAVPSIDETISIPSYKNVAEVEHSGRRYRMSGLVFNIGKQPGAHLRIKGFFVAPLHAQIHRQRDGTYVLQHKAGRQAVCVNGKPVTSQALRDGDEIAIGSHAIRFHLIDTEL